jgi:hypothetical protein
MEVLIIATFVLTIFSTIGQFMEVFLSWYMLRELGDIDKDKTDWWEKFPFVKRIRKKNNDNG